MQRAAAGGIVEQLALKILCARGIAGGDEAKALLLLRIGLDQRITGAAAAKIGQLFPGLADFAHVGQRNGETHALATPIRRAVSAARGIDLLLVQLLGGDLPETDLIALLKAESRQCGKRSDQDEADDEATAGEGYVELRPRRFAPVHVDEGGGGQEKGEKRHRPKQRKEQEDVAVVGHDVKPQRAFQCSAQ